MATPTSSNAAARRIASSGDLELAYPACPKGIGAVIGRVDSPDLIDGVRVQPFAVYPDDRGYFLEVQRIGQGLAALREDEDTARMLGVPTERYKIVMFVASAALTAVFGIIYAHSLGYITASSVYRIDFSLNMIVYNLLGGIGTLAGPVIGSAIMVVLTQVVLGRFLSVHMFFTGLLLVVLVLLAPKGILGLRLRRAR